MVDVLKGVSDDAAALQGVAVTLKIFLDYRRGNFLFLTLCIASRGSHAEYKNEHDERRGRFVFSRRPVAVPFCMTPINMSETLLAAPSCAVAFGRSDDEWSMEKRPALGLLSLNDGPSRSLPRHGVNRQNIHTSV